MFATVFPIAAVILLCVMVVTTQLLQKREREHFKNADEAQIEQKLREIQVNIKLNKQDENRVDRMFQAYMKVSQESSSELIQNPFNDSVVPAWVKTNDDINILVPYILPYMLGKKDSLPQSKEDALREHFSCSQEDFVNHDEMNIDEIDDMKDEEIQDHIRKSKLKDMDPREAEKEAYKTLHHLAHSKFDERFYDSVAYVAMTFAHKSTPHSTPESVRALGVHLKKELPAVVVELQKHARESLKKVEASKKKVTQKKKQLSLKQLRLKNKQSFRLDREAYMNSLPEYKRILLEEFTNLSGEEGFRSRHHSSGGGVIGKIFSSILSPVIKGMSAFIKELVKIATQTLTSLLPTLVNDVFIPTVNALVGLISGIFSNEALMTAIMNIIDKVITLSIEVGWKIIEAISQPIMKLFFKYVMPLLIKVVRFYIFMVRMIVRSAKTVWDMIVAFIKTNWSKIVWVFNYVVHKVTSILEYIYDFIEPYIAYAMYIITPIAVIAFVGYLGPTIFPVMNTILALGMTASPERTFRPTKMAVDASSN